MMHYNAVKCKISKLSELSANLPKFYRLPVIRCKTNPIIVGFGEGIFVIRLFQSLASDQIFVAVGVPVIA